LTIAGFFHTTPRHVKIANDLINAGKIPVDTFVTGKFSFARLEDAIRAHSSQKGIKSAIIYD
jgi:L-iditol 2-dehydrogenase